MGVGMNAQGTDALFPVIYLQVRDNASVDELRAMFDVLRAAGKRGTRHVTMTDSSTVKAMPDATIRRYVAEQQAEVEGLYGHLVIGSAVVVSAGIVRGALTAINWIKPTKVPQVFTTTRVDAVVQCIRWLEGERIAIPSPLRGFRMQLDVDPSTRPLGLR
jgi:hypothetical protein